MKLILITSLPLLLALGKIPLLAFAQDSGLKVIVDLEVPSSWCGKVFSSYYLSISYIILYNTKDDDKCLSK
jgi:hypothetical protein